jgi:LPXTG-site transpeptidase (sortase) family protein
MSGLHIQHQRNFHVIRWSVALIVMTLLFAYAYFGVRWYSTGELSPLPLPVAAADVTIDETPVTAQQIQSHTVPAEQPRYIEIPTLGVDQTRVTKVGVTANNMLDVPKALDDSGWYAKSALPGSGAGAVLIDGHNGGASRNGVFAKLGELKKGDQVTVERGDGERFTYEVFDVRDMPLTWVNQSGMKEMMKSAEPQKEGLSLITGSGKWIPKDKVFDRRILVRATILE